jgi:hypothetical protein
VSCHQYRSTTRRAARVVVHLRQRCGLVPPCPRQ